IMLLRPENEKGLFAEQPLLKWSAVGLGLLVFVQIAATLWNGLAKSPVNQNSAKAVAIGTVEAIGHELYTKYLLPFEAIGFLLLAATIGALVLAKKKLD
ncbi:MAG: NADH-quinone oxidoreductase subunit J, partial [Ignavibacteria bacterium]|nr:NADH-quinone oxidoreductase subunit J [Ignavibacteria bacterium]